MSFWKCVADALEEGSIDRERGERAQAMWKELADLYERQGHERHMAEALAAEDVKAAFAREAGEARHVYLAQLATMRRMQAEVSAAAKPDMWRTMERLDYRHRGLMRRFHASMSEFLTGLDRNLITGRPKNKAQMRNVIKELRGEATDDAAARSMAGAIRHAFNDMRRMFNEAGGLIGDLENWIPQSHNSRAVGKAGFDRWLAEIAPRLDWKRIEDPLTGRPMQAADGPPPSEEAQRRFLKETYDNIVFDRTSRDAVYGRVRGTAMYRKHSEQRVLHFKTADDWIAYNKQFGKGDPFASIMGHAHRMARDVALMRELGPNPGLGAEYRAQLWDQKARGNERLAAAAKKDANIALRMFRILSGGKAPETRQQEFWATFFSSARHVMTSAFLDKAIVASISDINTVRLAAQAMKLNPANVLARQVGLLSSRASRMELARAGWIADSLSDAGAALARFQQETPPAEVAELLATTSMRMQGLSQWTDNMRVAFQAETAGAIADMKGPLSKIDHPIADFLRRAGVTDAEFADFTNPAYLFRADNGATFASPFHWRAVTEMDPKRADEVFDKIQGMIDEQLEIAVPTQSLLARSMVDAAAHDLTPGTLPYELLKSMTMFKSFPMTFTVNQYRRMMSQPTVGGRIGYGLNVAGGMTILGALSLQIGSLLNGRDPEDMTTGDFWGRAIVRGGGLGIVGDIVSTGQASWGGGFGSYLIGPLPQAAQDAWDLTIKNVYEFATGQDTKFAQELGRIGKRYTPMGQTPLLGPTLDRLFWDQLSVLLDPEAADALARAAQRHEKRTGAASWWMPGSATPSRAPSLRSALGQ